MDYQEFEKYVCDQYRDIFKNDYDEDYAKKSAQKIWDSVDNKDDVKAEADVVINKTREEHFCDEKTFDSLSAIKDQLFDAPKEVKNAFNSLIGYFSKDKIECWRVYLEPMPGGKGLKRVQLVDKRRYKTKEEAREAVESEWKNCKIVRIVLGKTESDSFEVGPIVYPERE